MDELLVVRNVVKSFTARGSLGAELLRRARTTFVAVDDVSFEVGRREILGLVGESGSGKTTLARCLVRLVEPDSGSASFDGMDILGASASQLRRIRRRMQLIYQDPYSSLNPVLRVGDAIAEPARVHGLVKSRAAEQALVAELLEAVGLTRSDAQRRPREMSGGQRQRVAIARALALQPEMLIADEVVSALDVSVQAQILNLFTDLAQNRHLAMVFVSHQLAVIAQLAQRVAIMYRGRIVEIGSTADVFSAPQHPYTALLLAAHPGIDQPKRRRTVAPPVHSAPTGPNPTGCRFRDRCPLAEAICAEVDPPAVDLGNGHLAWCHVVPKATISHIAATTNTGPSSSRQDVAQP